VATTGFSRTPRAFENRNGGFASFSEVSKSTSEQPQQFGHTSGRVAEEVDAIGNC